MEIKVTDYVKDAEHQCVSGSVAELGYDAAQFTWETAMQFSEDHMFVNDDSREQLQDHFSEYGAWDREEIESWTDQELNALLLQLISGDYRNITEHGDREFLFRLYACKGEWYYGIDM